MEPFQPLQPLQTHTCEKGCCTYQVTPYHHHQNIPYYTTPHSKIKKAGCFVFDKQKNKILLVQSRGQMWGPPKGSIQEYETPLNCALREVKEETGIDIREDQFSGSMIIKSKALYYFIETDSDQWNVHPQNHIEDNDANGIGWFNVDCLEYFMKGELTINQHCSILIKKIFEKDVFRPTYHKRLLPESE